MKLYLAYDEKVIRIQESNSPFSEWEHRCSYMCKVVADKDDIPQGYMVKDFTVNCDTCDSIYLLLARYSEGDSFGTRYNNIDFINMFEKKSDAEFWKDILQKHYQLKAISQSPIPPQKKKQEKEKIFNQIRPHLVEPKDLRFSIPYEYFPVINGVQYCPPYGGYFEPLDEIEVVKCEIGKKLTL